MKIWLINPYGPIPSEAWREYRYALFGKFFSDQGHEVIWFTSNFSHHFKRYRSKTWKTIEINRGFKITLVPTSSYYSNVGFGRLFRDCLFSFRMFKYGRHFDVPDIIIYYESPFSFSYSGYQLAKYFKIPVIFDQVDLWPEFFEQYFPRYLNRIIKICLLPVYFNRNETNKRMNGFISLANPYLENPLKKLKPENELLKAVIYNGIDVKEFKNMMEDDEKDEIIKKILPKKLSSEIWIIFAGTLGPSYDLTTIMFTALEFEQNGFNQFKFIIAGDGPMKNQLNEFITKHKLKNLNYIGFINSATLCRIYKSCDIGLCSYSYKSNVQMPDKFYDFTAAGLAIFNSLNGEISDWVSEKQLGFNYEPGNIEDLKLKLLLLGNNSEQLANFKYRSSKIALEFDKYEQIKKLSEIVNKLVKL